MGLRYKVLIADDEPIGQQLMEAVLVGEGYEFFFAQDGLEVINLAIKNKPDLILLDVMMPELDGFEVCERIRSSSTIKDTPIFLITALEDKDSRIKGLNLGANDFISKPYNRVEVLAKVRNILKSRSENIAVEHAKTPSESGLFNLENETTRNILNFSDSFTVLFPMSEFEVRDNTADHKHTAWCGRSYEENCLIFYQVPAKDSLQLEINKYLNSWLFNQEANITFQDEQKFFLNFKSQICLLFSNNLLKSETDFWYVLLKYSTTSKTITISGVNQQVFIASNENKQIKIYTYDLQTKNNLKPNPNKSVYLLSKNILNEIGLKDITNELIITESNFNKAAKINHLASLINKSKLQESIIAFRMVIN